MSLPRRAPGSPPSRTARAALKYAEAGYSVFPVGTDKKPLTRNGFHGATTDEGQIRTWWRRHPTANIGLRPPEGVVILDVDPRHGGTETMALLATELGELPRGPVALTGGGGQHLWLALDGGPFRSPGTGIDVKTHDSGYVVVPPSIHQSGKPYRWDRDRTLSRNPVAPAPTAWADRLRAPKRADEIAEGCDIPFTKAVAPNQAAWVRRIIDDDLPRLRSRNRSGRNNGLNDVGLRLARCPVDREWLRTRLVDAAVSSGVDSEDGRKQTHGTITSAFTTADRDGLPDDWPEPIWPNVIEIGQTTAGDPPESPPSATSIEAIEGDFWQSQESLRTIYATALARMCSPWAVLGFCAARALATVRPHVTLPPLIGGMGTLNWFCAITAISGGGKGAASAVARDLIKDAVLQRNLGSGEGMIEAYVRPKDEETGQPAGFHESVMFVADEVDTLAAMRNRSGATTLGVLRSAFSGETLGFSYRSNGKHLAALSYRMTLVISVQPARAGTLLDDHGGGTPQRFMWFPANDHRISADTVDVGPVELSLPKPNAWRYPVTLSVPDEASRLIKTERAKAGRGEQDALDSHALYAREKFAFALAILDGRDRMTSEDWRLSGIAAAVSDHTRAWVSEEYERAALDEAAREGRTQGARRFAADQESTQRVHQDERRLAKWAIGKLTAAGPDGLTERALSRYAKEPDRHRVGAAFLQRLATAGYVEKIERRPKDRSDRWAVPGVDDVV